MSDLHIDSGKESIKSAADTVTKVCKSKGIEKLFIGGDTSDYWEISLKFIELIREKGVQAYTIFGNHEYLSLSYKEARKLSRPEYIGDSYIKLNNNSVVIAIDGLHDYSFVLDVDNQCNKSLPKSIKELNEASHRKFNPYKYKIGNYKKVFDRMMDNLKIMLEINKSKEIIVMLHYVPHVNFIKYKNNNKGWNINNSYMGSTHYSKLFERYNVKKVIFGHTHDFYDKTINGVRYHCNAIGYQKTEYDKTFEERLNERMLVVDI